MLNVPALRTQEDEGKKEVVLASGLVRDRPGLGGRASKAGRDDSLAWTPRGPAATHTHRAWTAGPPPGLASAPGSACDPCQRPPPLSPPPPPPPRHVGQPCFPSAVPSPPRTSRRAPKHPMAVQRGVPCGLEKQPRSRSTASRASPSSCPCGTESAWRRSGSLLSVGSSARCGTSTALPPLPPTLTALVLNILQDASWLEKLKNQDRYW